jgi:hypothetical protein
MKWIGERISFLDSQQKTTILIESEKNFWVNALMGSWLSMWVTIGTIIVWAYFSIALSDEEKIALAVFMSFWLYFTIRISRAFFWLIWGKESIKIDETALYYKRSIRGYGRSHVYYLENIRKIRLFTPKEKSFQSVWEASPWIRGGERLEFDYMNKVVRFGRKLNEKDSKLLYQLITKKVEERLKKR